MNDPSKYAAFHVNQFECTIEDFLTSNDLIEQLRLASHIASLLSSSKKTPCSYWRKTLLVIIQDKNPFLKKLKTLVDSKEDSFIWCAKTLAQACCTQFNLDELWRAHRILVTELSGPSTPEITLGLVRAYEKSCINPPTSALWYGQQKKTDHLLLADFLDEFPPQKLKEISLALHNASDWFGREDIWDAKTFFQNIIANGKATIEQLVVLAETFPWTLKDPEFIILCDQSKKRNIESNQSTFTHFISLLQKHKIRLDFSVIDKISDQEFKSILQSLIIDPNTVENYSDTKDLKFRNALF